MIIRHVENQNQNQISALCWSNRQDQTCHYLSQLDARKCDFIQRDSSRLDLVQIDLG